MSAVQGTEAEWAAGQARDGVRHHPREKSQGDFVGAVIGNIIILALISIYPLWQPHTRGVVTEDWVRILWAADLSLLLQIGGNLMLLFFSPIPLRRFLELTFAAAGLLSVAVFYTVFPLDFSHVVGEWLNMVARIVLICGIVGASIGVIVGIVRFIGSAWRAEA